MSRPQVSHYQRGEIEPWDVIQDWKLDYWLGNVLKYLCRGHHKHAFPVEDLEKARDYLDEAISQARLRAQADRLHEEGWVREARGRWSLTSGSWCK